MAALLACILATPSASAQATNKGVKIEQTNGQYQVTGKTYSLLVSNAGLLTALRAGNVFFVQEALVLSVGKEFNLPGHHACAKITQTQDDTLECEGEHGILTYQFTPEGVLIVVKSKVEPIKLFLRVSREVEGILADSPSHGRQVSVGGTPIAAQGLKEAQFYRAGQILRVGGMESLYSESFLRLDLAANAKAQVQLSLVPASPEQKGVFTLPPLYSKPLVVLSPLDWQVFQRRTPAEGVIQVAGRIQGPGDRIEFRRGDEPWHEVPWNPVTGDFAASFQAPAGGWYRCEVRVLKEGSVIGAQVIEHVGVGEVFVVAGQSNSSNSGEEKQQPTSGMVSTFSGTSWRPAEDPQPGVHDASGKGSPWPAFGDALADEFKVPIGLAVTGHGGTRVERWQPGGALFQWTQTRIQQLGHQGFRMVLWHQGESDGSTDPEEYARLMQGIIEQSHLRAGWSFPWMVARVCNTKGQDLLIRRGIALEGPSTDGLQGEFRGQNGKDVHFSAKGLEKHGQLWAEKVRDSVQGTPQFPPAEAPDSEVGVPAATAAPGGAAKVEWVDGQYRVSGSTYSAIIGPTGLLNFLEVGDMADRFNKRVLINEPFDLCVDNEFNTRTSQRVCPLISQPEPGLLLCSGPDMTIGYRFGAKGFTLELEGSAHANGRLFAVIKDTVEGCWTDGRSAGPQVYPSILRGGDHGVRRAKFLSSNHTVSIENVSAYYHPRRLRWDVAKGQKLQSTWSFAPADAQDRALFARPQLYREALTVLSPAEYQVFQRHNLKEGRVRVAGRVKVAVDQLEFRFNGDRWIPLPIRSLMGDFAAELIAPAGGWYRCELRGLKDGKTVVEKVVEHVGVGEVFVAAGQSNSTNAGDKKLKPASGMVATYDGEGWRLAEDPQPGVYDGSGGGSFYPPLGDLLHAKFQVPIAFAVTGKGGSSVAQWHPGGELFTWMQERVLQLGPQGFRCLLWHQGEADATTPEQEYYDRLKTIVEQSNLRARWSFPWMVAQLGGWQTKKAKVRLWADGVALEGPDTDTLLGPENRQQNGKNPHFTELGLQRHAGVWETKLSPYLENILNEKK